MKNLILTAKLDISESLRARWFLLYSVIFGGIIALLFIFGLTESRIMGFTGLSRLLITYIQLCMAILPVFILITTVRSVAGDREAGVFEYMLSLPVSLAAWFWGKMIGRFMVVFIPVFLAMFVAVIWGGLRNLNVPWSHFWIYSALLISLAWCFLGIGMFISAIARSSDIAQTSAFLLWLFLLLFLDLVLLGVLIKEQLPLEMVTAIALINPLQVFRTGAMIMFDPQLVLIGPAAYTILDLFTPGQYLVVACLYPFFLGSLLAFIGYSRFKKGDLP